MTNKKAQYTTPTVALLAMEDVIMASAPSFFEEGEGDFGEW